MPSKRLQSPLFGAMALLCVCVTSPARADQTSGFAGAYSDASLRIELKQVDAGNYTGTFIKGAQRFPLAAQASAQKLAGVFEASGQRFDFSAVLADDLLTLDTGGKRYALKRERIEAPNPLARAPENPLTRDGKLAAPVPAQTRPADAAAKDPLAYRVLQLPGGAAAKFDNWTYSPIQSAANLIYCDAVPNGRQDFFLRAAIGTPNAQDQANLFVAGPQLVQQALGALFGPGFQRVGEPKKSLCGGDEALVETYAGAVRDKKLTCRVIYVKRKDIAIAVMAIGTEDGFKDFGRSIEIVAQSITFKESQLEPALVGTFTLEKFASANSGLTNDTKLNVATTRSITIYPNGTFSDTATSGFSSRDAVGLSDGANRGAVVKRGNVLTFTYDNGTKWSTPYEIYSNNGLKLNGALYIRQ